MRVFERIASLLPFALTVLTQEAVFEMLSIAHTHRRAYLVQTSKYSSPTMNPFGYLIILLAYILAFSLSADGCSMCDDGKNQSGGKNLFI